MTYHRSHQVDYCNWGWTEKLFTITCLLLAVKLRCRLRMPDSHRRRTNLQMCTIAVCDKTQRSTNDFSCFWIKILSKTAINCNFARQNLSFCTVCNSGICLCPSVTLQYWVKMTLSNVQRSVAQKWQTPICTPAHMQLNTLNIHTVRLSPHYPCSQAVFTASVNSACEHGPQTWVSKMTPMLDTSVHNPRTRVVSADP